MLIDPANTLSALTISGLIVAVLNLPRLRIGLNLGDEGYLWYGTLQTLEGKIPIRDFRAYDPGRYYWCAGWMWFLGRKVIHLRIIVLITQVLALSFGLLIVNYLIQNWLITIVAGAFLAKVMKPVHKIFEYFASSAAVFMTLLLLSNPAPENFFLAGLFAGLSFFFGLNLGLYNFIAISFVISFKLVTSGSIPVIQTMMAYTTGLTTGLLPIAAMLLLVPGMMKKYWQKKIRVVLRRGTTNLKVPFPWLWRPTPNHLRHHNKFYQWCFKVCFTLMPFTYALLLGWTLLNGRVMEPANQVLVASLIVGIPYMHHLFARADVSHLLVGGYPLMFCLAALSVQWQLVWSAILTILIVGFFLVASSALTPDYVKRQHRDSLVVSSFDDNILLLPRHQAEYLQMIRNAVEKYSKPGDPVLFLPMFVTFYPLLNRKAPVYDIFCVYKATAEAQEEMIKSLSEKNVQLAVIDNSPVDGMAERAWEKTHPMVFDYLQMEYNTLETNSRYPNLIIFTRKTNS